MALILPTAADAIAIVQGYENSRVTEIIAQVQADMDDPPTLYAMLQGESYIIDVSSVRLGLRNNAVTALNNNNPDHIATLSSDQLSIELVYRPEVRP